MEEALSETTILRQFAGLSLERIPDETTILNFRRLLEKHELAAGSLGVINGYLGDRGLSLRQGTIVDATLIHAPSSTKNKEGKRDPEMHQYIFLLSNFIEKYSLRYDLRSPCTLCPTLPGIFSSLIRELRVLTTQNEHLNMLMNDFEESIRDLRQDSSDRRIKTAIQKQVNLIEALGALCPGVTSGELGRICSEVSSWPHRAVSGSLKSLYGFASDYPGIRHAGNPKGVTRQIDMRDLVAISILLAGFTPYLCDTFDPKSIYLGS
jgi:hypothetical protein